MSEKSVGISIAIDVEADEITVVIEAIDGGGANAVGGVDGLPLDMMRWIGQQEPMHLGRIARSDDLVRCVDAQECRAGHICNSGVIEDANSGVLISRLN